MKCIVCGNDCTEYISLDDGQLQPLCNECFEGFEDYDDATEFVELLVRKGE